MSLSPTLRYYRGQFNPEAAYQQQGSDSGIISMYNPQEQNALIEATMKRQERFDTAKMAQAQEIARIGEMETYDMAELNNRLKSFEGGINDLVKNKYNGDYSAAANEIAKQIGTERTNPFYHFNKQKVESGKAYLDAKMKLGANFLSTADPFEVKFQDWQQGKTFEFTPINKEDIVKAASIVGQNFAKTVTSDSGLQLSPEGQYFKNTVQYGIKDLEHLDEFIAKSGLDKQIFDSMPELANIKNQDAIHDAIRQGLTSAVGTTESRYMANQAYLDPMNAAKLAALGAPQEGLTQTGFTESPSNVNDVINSPLYKSTRDPLAVAEAKKLGIPNINSYDDLVNFKKNKWSSLRAGAGDDERLAKQALNNVKDQLDIKLKTNSQMFVSPTWNMNEFAPRDASERNDFVAIKKGLNEYVNNPASVTSNDLIGATPSDDKKLKDLNEKQVLGFFFVPTSDANNPTQLGLELTGTKGSGTKKEVVNTKALINSTSFIDQDNILSFLAKVDRRVYNMMLKQKETIMGKDAFDKWMKDSGINRVSPK